MFIALWSLVVYSPIAHWVWGGGWLAKMGALDFAGGTVVHVNAGVAALVAAIVLGQRTDYRASGAPAAQRAVHAARRRPAVVRLVRLQRRQRAGAEPLGRARVHDDDAGAGGHAGRLDAARPDAQRQGRPPSAPRRRIVVGLVAITPAAGFVSPMSAHRARRHRGVPELLRARAGARSTRLDDSLDVVAAHGARRHGRRAADRRLRARRRWNGVADGLLFGNPGQLGIQATAVGAAIVYSGVVSFVLLKLIGLVMPLRAEGNEEGVGMDVTQHGEEAYAEGEGAILVLPTGDVKIGATAMAAAEGGRA